MLTEQQERDVLWKSIEVLEKFTGKKPTGFTAPAWTPSRHTVRSRASRLLRAQPDGPGFEPRSVD
jgi:peptidoglycan/xylan/chitin deacetylase (PgdA/CDA1 family)